MQETKNLNRTCCTSEQRFLVPLGYRVNGTRRGTAAGRRGNTSQATRRSPTLSTHLSCLSEELQPQSVELSEQSSPHNPSGSPTGACQPSGPCHGPEGYQAAQT